MYVLACICDSSPWKHYYYSFYHPQFQSRSEIEQLHDYICDRIAILDCLYVYHTCSTYIYNSDHENLLLSISCS